MAKSRSDALAVADPREVLRDRIREWVAEGRTETQVVARAEELNCTDGLGLGVAAIAELIREIREEAHRDAKVDAEIAGDMHTDVIRCLVQEACRYRAANDGAYDPEALAGTLRMLAEATGYRGPPGLDQIAAYAGNLSQDDAARELDAIRDGELWAPPKFPRLRFDVRYIGDPSRRPDLTQQPALIHNLLYPGYVVLTGPWKRSYKTLLSLALGYAIHTGRPTALERTVRQARVCWVQRDMGEPDFHAYSDMIQRGHGFDERGIPYIAEPLDLQRTEDRALLVATLKDLGTELLILDSSRAVSSVDELKSDTVRTFVREFLIDVLRDRHGISTLLIAHPPKGGTGVRGAGDWEASADSILMLAPRYRDAEETQVDHVTIGGLGRHPPVEAAFRVAFDGEGADASARVELVDLDAERENRKLYLLDKIAGAVRDVGSCSRTALGDLLRTAQVRFGQGDLTRLIYAAAERHPEMRIDRSGQAYRVSWSTGT